MLEIESIRKARRGEQPVLQDPDKAIPLFFGTGKYLSQKDHGPRTRDVRRRVQVRDRNVASVRKKTVTLKVKYALRFVRDLSVHASAVAYTYTPLDMVFTLFRPLAKRERGHRMSDLFLAGSGPIARTSGRSINPRHFRLQENRVAMTKTGAATTAGDKWPQSRRF